MRWGNVLLRERGGEYIGYRTPPHEHMGVVGLGAGRSGVHLGGVLVVGRDESKNRIDPHSYGEVQLVLREFDPLVDPASLKEGGAIHVGVHAHASNIPGERNCGLVVGLENRISGSKD